MKKLLCILLTFSLAISISVPAFAQENATSERESLLNPDEETMFEQMMRQLPYDEEFLLEEGAISLESLGQPMAIDDKASVQSTTYYYKTLTMPAAMFYIVTVGYRDKDYTSATYNGNECYKFTRGNIIVYVKKTAFCTDSSGKEKSGKIGSASLISTNLTNYLNSGNSDFYYTGMWSVFYADGLDYVQLALYGSQAFKYEEDEVVLQHKAIAETNSGLNTMTALSYPTLQLQIANTGSGNRYLGGYYVKGVGSNTSVDDIASLIDLGYKTAKVASGAAVSNLKFDDVASLFNTMVGLSKTGVLTKTYLSDTVALSNVSKNIYAYSCSLKSPFELNGEGHYFQTHIGLNGADGTSLRYTVTVSLDSSRG